MLSKVLTKMPSILRRQGAPMRADLEHSTYIAWSAPPRDRVPAASASTKRAPCCVVILYYIISYYTILSILYNTILYYTFQFSGCGLCPRRDAPPARVRSSGIGAGRELKVRPMSDLPTYERSEHRAEAFRRSLEDACRAKKPARPASPGLPGGKRAEPGLRRPPPKGDPKRGDPPLGRWRGSTVLLTRRPVPRRRAEGAERKTESRGAARLLKAASRRERSRVADSLGAAPGLRPSPRRRGSGPEPRPEAGPSRAVRAPRTERRLGRAPLIYMYVYIYIYIYILLLLFLCIYLYI